MSSKKVIEFTVGDPKSNQQTASKLDCQIIVNNNNAKSGSKNQAQHKSDTNKFAHSTVIDGVHVYQDDDENNACRDVEMASEDDVTTDTEVNDQVNSGINTVNNLMVKIPVNVSQDRDIGLTSRFYVTARSAPVLKEEILRSMDVKNTLIHILTNLLCNNDHALLANILDKTGRIVLGAEDFASLVAVMLSANGQKVSMNDIKINYRDEFITTCLKVKLLPFKTILNVQVGEQDLRIHQYEVWNCLNNDFNVSTETIYYPVDVQMQFAH